MTKPPHAADETTAVGTVITEDDIAALDTQSVLDEPLEATDPINQKFLRAASWAAAAITIIMLVLVTLSVVMRYVFNSSIDLAAEGPSYLLPWLICAGAIVAQAQMAHVGVNFFLEKLHGRAFEIASIAIWIFVAILMAYLTYLGAYMAGPMSAQITPIMGWPQIGSFAAFIVMTACLSIQAAVRAWFFYRKGAVRSIDIGSPVEAEDAVKEVHGV
ncbi:TRAP transporter small permease [Schaalia hyovaginalis]|uniref:TRAP transporter small permease n=1 Tax=Schaalia TaxID=2529408 RepID=UPI001F4513B7|nr:TRAP transporter small permease [Schaalia hyovaginalis]MCF2710171.1 TRAP transporter small permease [Schaalia hyovaginalis]MCI6410821.1 TRAP transporter small permease [Schaalia hyovaginalis]MCI7512459.1 TRAP transporter small permease [Schaalia hyovaginalis]MDY3094564.1 TRAP transporter small permease [Schaalia hyovaginalis]MDY3665060.1 TRAP transporter small permease [Schaalia hyovaginalis]